MQFTLAGRERYHTGMDASVKPPVDWQRVQTVLLDMDGTLLDLHFDNHFWQDFVPARWGAARGMSLEQAKQVLYPRFRAAEGTLDWYCLDHWTRELEIDILALKNELSHLIRVLPHVQGFLERLRAQGKRVVLVTNAHGDALSLKMQHTELHTYFDTLISAHELGIPKEGAGFWEAVQAIEPFPVPQAAFFDDSLPVLQAARDYGIGQVVAMRRPDSRFPARNFNWMPAIETFQDVMPLS